MKKILLLILLLCIPIVYSQEVFLSIDDEPFLLNISGPDFPLAFIAGEGYNLKSWGTPDITKTVLRAIGSSWEVTSPNGINEAEGVLSLPEGMYELEITGYIDTEIVTVEKINMVLYVPEIEEESSKASEGEGGKSEGTEGGGLIQTQPEADNPPVNLDNDRIVQPEKTNTQKAKDIIDKKLTSVIDPIGEDGRKFWLFIGIGIVVVVFSIIIVILARFLRKRDNF